MILKVIDVENLDRVANCDIFETGDVRYEYCDNEVNPDDLYMPRYISRLKKRGKTIFQRLDYSETGRDMYDPFHYSKQDLVVMYEFDGKKHYMFRPGYVVIENERCIKHRKPHFYYGECDCAE
jgi:hypothetical protein